MKNYLCFITWGTRNAHIFALMPKYSIEYFEL
jgi:hypothetical protein